jgi:hypothetical protein
LRESLRCSGHRTGIKARYSVTDAEETTELTTLTTSDIPALPVVQH